MTNCYVIDSRTEHLVDYCCRCQKRIRLGDKVVAKHSGHCGSKYYHEKCFEELLI